MESESFGLIRIDEVLEALDSGEIIEDYPEDQPYPSCLILGRTRANRPLHVVCAPVVDEQRLIVITIYQPDPARWEADLKGRKRL
ncbi:MAG: DUF4258 domain-containing protein [Deltaproteobacteria bacterium]|nr:DUF4258 domain-containing protein [Deltaproteobacteria bacterium]